MASAASISLDYANVLTHAIGPVHGLSKEEIQRSAGEAKGQVERIEAERKGGKHRFRDLPNDAGMIKAVEAAAKRWKPGVENLVVLGIGGSALGNIALQTALNPAYHNLLPASQRRGPRLFVMDNVDPVQFASLMDVLKPTLKKTVFNVISKSGETAETASQFLIVRDWVASTLGAKALTKHIIVTTDPESGTLRDQAAGEGYETLAVPPGVGGRFSVLSAVGLFSAAMCGINIRKLLAGAAAMSIRAGETNVAKNPAAMLALLLTMYYTRGKRMHVMFSYAHALKDLSDWYCQLWAESLGKCHDTSGEAAVVGPTPIKALGATDQHSQVQLYREGPNDKVFLFLECEKFARDVAIPKSKVKGLGPTPDATAYLLGKSLGKLINAEKQATERALVASQRACMTIRFPKVSEETVGQFIMLWEAATSIAGGLLNIDPYDQPAVQLGKDYTYALMGKKGYEKIARELERSAGKSDKFVV